MGFGELMDFYVFWWVMPPLVPSTMSDLMAMTKTRKVILLYH